MADKHYSGKLGDFDYDDTQYALADASGSHFKYIGSETDGSRIQIPQGMINCTSLFAHSRIKSQPEIPDSVKCTDAMFLGCDDMTAAGTIPDGVIDAGSMYSYSGIKQAPAIPDSVRNADFMFDGCSDLGSIQNFPKNAVSLKAFCAGCTGLESVPELPQGVSNMDCTFLNCTSIKNPPVTPESVKNMQSAYSGCTSLESAPNIPSGVCNTTDMLEGCPCSQENTEDSPSSVYHAEPYRSAEDDTVAASVPAENDKTGTYSQFAEAYDRDAAVNSLVSNIDSAPQDGHQAVDSLQ